MVVLLYVVIDLNVCKFLLRKAARSRGSCYFTVKSTQMVVVQRQGTAGTVSELAAQNVLEIPRESKIFGLLFATFSAGTNDAFSGDYTCVSKAAYWVAS